VHRGLQTQQGRRPHGACRRPPQTGARLAEPPAVLPSVLCRPHARCRGTYVVGLVHTPHDGREVEQLLTLFAPATVRPPMAAMCHGPLFSDA
jgi:hypothetical protein